MKNKVVTIDENTLGIEIIYKNETKYAYIDKDDLNKIDFIKGT